MTASLQLQKMARYIST